MAGALSPKALEEGRVLFAQACEFVRGVAQLDGIPPTRLPEIAFAGTHSGDVVLVAPRPDGQRHCLPQRTGRPFRMVLWNDPAQDALGRALARSDHWGVSNDWAATNAYGPQAQRVPDMPAKKAEATAIVQGRLNAATNAIAYGLLFGAGVNEGQPGGRVDWLQMWGSSYGGITGGGYRAQYDPIGACVVIGGDTTGLLELQARAFAISNRMPALIVTPQGTVPKLEDYLDATGKPIGGWRMSGADARFDTDHSTGQAYDAPFGYWQAAHGINTANVADYAALQAYAPIDFQHADRAFSSLVALAWITNDDWAKWRIRQYAEVWRMAQFSHGLAGEVAMMHSLPGHGTTWGRAHGLNWTLSCAAYALSGDAWRTRWLPWFQQAADVFLTGQMANGLFRANAANKDAIDPPYGDGHTATYAIQRITEDALIVNALACLLGSIPTGRSATLKRAIVGWADAGLWRFLWRSGANGASPAAHNAVRPAAFGATPFTTPVLWDGGDSSEIGSAIGYALHIGGTDLRALVEKYAGSTTPLVTLMARKLDATNGIDDILPLIAALQQP